MTINKHAQPIQNSAERMAHLTSQLLAYARGGKYQPQQISLNNFVLDTLPFIKHLIKAGIVVESDLTEDFCYVEADLTQMQMVLLALMMNAAEATRSLKVIFDSPLDARTSTKSLSKVMPT